MDKANTTLPMQAQFNPAQVQVATTVDIDFGTTEFDDSNTTNEPSMETEGAQAPNA